VSSVVCSRPLSLSLFLSSKKKKRGRET
jgi:hypothetical protein